MDFCFQVPGCCLLDFQEVFDCRPFDMTDTGFVSHGWLSVSPKKQKKNYAIQCVSFRVLLFFCFLRLQIQ